MSVREDLNRVVELLVDAPDRIEIEEDYGADLLEMRLASQDLGKVIGRQGRTVRALRTVLAARALPSESPLELKILDD